MNSVIDIFLACAPKDFNKLPFVVNGIVENIPERGEIFICSPVAIPKDIQNKIEYDYNFIYDHDILSEKAITNWKFRPSWHTQQCLKLFQKVSSDWYLTWDCDTIACRKIIFTEDDRHIYYSGWEQWVTPYFDFQQKLIGIGRVAPFTFIADMNLIYRPYIDEMLDKNNLTVKSFIDKSQEIVTDKCFMAEPELYGSYIWVNHRTEYIFKKLKQADCIGREQHATNGYVWSEKDIIHRINQYKNNEYDTVAIHSWLVN